MASRRLEQRPASQDSPEGLRQRFESHRTPIERQVGWILALRQVEPLAFSMNRQSIATCVENQGGTAWDGNSY